MFFLSHSSTIEGLKSKLQLEYNALERHLVNLKMVINGEKSQLMLMSTNKKLQQITITAGGQTIRHQDTMKILGITLSHNGKFDNHVRGGKTNLIRQIHSRMAMLRIIRPHIPLSKLAQVGNSVLTSTIAYGAAVWGETSEKNLNLIQRAQTQAARIVLNIQRKKGSKQIHHRQDMLDELKWPNVQQIVFSTTVNLAKQAASNVSSTDLNELLNYTTPKLPRGPCRARIRNTAPCNRKGNGFSVRAVKNFNSLPPELTNKQVSTISFKRKAKEHIRTILLLPKH